MDQKILKAEKDRRKKLRPIIRKRFVGKHKENVKEEMPILLLLLLQKTKQTKNNKKNQQQQKNKNAFTEVETHH